MIEYNLSSTRGVRVLILWYRLHYYVIILVMYFVLLTSTCLCVCQPFKMVIKEGRLKMKCLGIIATKLPKKCPAGLEVSKSLPIKLVSRDKIKSREENDRKLQKTILNFLEENQVSKNEVMIVAIGWLYILSPWFIKEWKNRILNVHPALLPKYGGRGMYALNVHKAVLAAREKNSGCTIHLMDEGVDTGPILLQKTCPVLKGDTPESLQSRVINLWKKWYPEVLSMIEEGEIKLPD